VLAHWNRIVHLERLLSCVPDVLTENNLLGEHLYVICRIMKAIHIIGPDHSAIKICGSMDPPLARARLSPPSQAADIMELDWRTGSRKPSP